MAGVLGAATVAELRALVEGFFPDSCQVITVTYSGGGPSTSRVESSPGSAIGCKLRTTGFNPTERVIASRIQTGTVYAVDLPYGTPVTARDILTVNGRRMEVFGDPIEGGEEAMLMTAICVERG